MQEKLTLYILMLVPYEPTTDPRVAWVTHLCAQITRTHLISFTYSIGEKPAREYDGVTYTERVNPYDYFAISQPWRFHRMVRIGLQRLGIEARVLQQLKKLKAGLLSMYSYAATTLSYQDRGESSHTKVMESPGRGFPAASGHNAFGKGVRGAICTKIREQRRDIAHCISILTSFYLIPGTLYRHTRAVSIIPQLIICYDIYALIAGIKLKKLFGCPVLYDSHEPWKEALLETKSWQKKLIALIERRFIRYADAIITREVQSVDYTKIIQQLIGIQDQ
jgi:hypothetical protein